MLPSVKGRYVLVSNSGRPLVADKAMPHASCSTWTDQRHVVHSLMGTQKNNEWLCAV